MQASIKNSEQILFYLFLSTVSDEITSVDSDLISPNKAPPAGTTILFQHDLPSKLLYTVSNFTASSSPLKLNPFISILK